jgi:4-amino-4-deoxy-L-arabinose transferase-like glycosyltransferase
MVRIPPRQSGPPETKAPAPLPGAHLLYSVVLTLIRKHRWWFAGTALAAVLLRLFFIWKMATVTDDSVFYGEIAKCLIQNHEFGVEKATGWVPTLSRLPGYPLFLAFSFLIGGVDRYLTAMLLQLVFDMLSCLLVADIARRVVGERAARTAFVLAAFCPFLMNYVAAPLTECLEIFCIAAALDCAVVALDWRDADHGQVVGARRWWTLCGLCCAGAIVLRPDGGLILAGIGLPMLALGWRTEKGPGTGLRSRTLGRRELLTASLLLGAVSLAPLVPWTIRNWRVFHVFQPLVTTHASDPGEFVPLGWERWFRSWLIDYASVEDVGFLVPGLAVDPGKIPERAYNSDAQRTKVQRLLEQYNTNDQMTPELDRQFGALAEENIRLHPVRYYLLLPAARTVDMWLRPRSELMPLDTHFWKIAEDPRDASCGLALAALNLAYVAAAVAGAWVMRRRVRYLGLLLTYPVLRSVFLATTGAAEDRYTLECFPFVFVLAAAFLSWWQSRGVAAEDGEPDTGRPELEPRP